MGTTRLLGVSAIALALAAALPARASSPFHGSPAAIPGRIEAEDYDVGGQNDAYHDSTPGNAYGISAYRDNHVDFRATTDVGGGYYVGRITPGEWLNYTVEVARAGTYSLRFRVASAVSGRTFHVEMNGSDVTGTLTVPDTGAWQSWTTLSKTVTLQAGVQVLKLVAGTGGFNINYLDVVAAVTPSPSPSPAPTAAPPPLAGCPSPLKVCVDISLPAEGRTVNVPPGSDLQAAIDKAVPGDTLVLAAGATYPGPLTLPVKSGSGWIVIRGAALTPAGRRVKPAADAAQMPKIVQNSIYNEPGIAARPGAHHYRFIGVEITARNSGKYNTNLILLGDPADQKSMSDLPHHITFDRCYIHQTSGTNMVRGLAMNGAHLALIDSHVSGFNSPGTQSQAAGGWSGSGPFKVNNNYLEGAGENFLYGGSDPSIAGLVPSDLEFRGNSVRKPLSWKSDPFYKGAICNLFELKNMDRAFVDGNVFDGNWESCQQGAGVVFTPRNQNGTAPQTVVQNVLFTNNVVRNSGQGINILGVSRESPNGTYDLHYATRRTNHLMIRNNLLYAIGGSLGSGYGMQMMEADTVTLERNTFFQTGNAFSADYGYGRTANINTGFVMNDNILHHGSYGFFGSNVGEGDRAWSAFFSGSAASGNVMIGMAPGEYKSFAGSSFPASDAEVGFVDVAGGNYSLGSSSADRGKGVDCAALNAAVHQFGESIATGCGY